MPIAHADVAMTDGVIEVAIRATPAQACPTSIDADSKMT
jgi:N-acyl-D-aspartate/D-glutamate deacylase